MRICILSDSHGDIYAVKRAINCNSDADMYIHLGDYCRDAISVSRELKKDIIYVKGNCDYTPGVDLEKTITAGGKTIFITHGHNYYVKSGYTDLYFKAQEVGADIVLYGHTHFAESFEEGGIQFLNPGSLSQPRSMHESYAILTIDEGIAVPNIVELY